MRKKISLIIVVIFGLQVITNFNQVAMEINSATSLFIKKIFPSLFPFFILSDLLVNYGFIDVITTLFSKITNFLFKINKNSSYILFMSIISGFPSSAKYTKELLDKNLINECDGTKILMFSHFSNPLFILSMISNRPLLIIFSHYIGNFIIGLFVRNKYISPSTHTNIHSKPLSFIQVLTNSIKKSIDSLLLILGIIVVFFIISSIINTSLTNVILELSQGINYMNNSLINPRLQAVIIASLLSFGGLSVHMQIYSILSETKIRYKPYLLSRIFHSIISGIIVYILY